MELFEEIRREYRFGVGTIQGVAKKLNTHRRMVRQALASAIPPERKTPARSSLGLLRDFLLTPLRQPQRVPPLFFGIRIQVVKSFFRIRVACQIEIKGISSLICATSSLQETPYVQEWAADAWFRQARRVGSKPDSRLFSFFRLTAARNGRIPVVPQPRIEGRGVNQGRRVRPCLPPIPVAEF